MRLNGELIDNTIEQVEKDNLITLKNTIETTSLIEIDFESTVYINQTRFDTYLLNRQLGESVRQPVDSGDASTLIKSNEDAIEHLKTTAQIHCSNATKT